MPEKRDRDGWARDRDESNIVFIAAAVVLVAIGVGVFYFLSVSPAPKSTYAIPIEVVGRLDQESREVAHRLGAEPCNRTLAVRLANVLLRKSEYAAVLAFIEKTESACGPNEDFAPVVFFAQKGSSDFSGAEKTASALLEKHPGSYKLYAWRAEARHKKGDVEGAFEDYRKSIYLIGDPKDVSTSGVERLAKLAAEAKRPCEAVSVLRDFVAADQAKRRTPGVMTMIEKWRSEGSCPPPFGHGKAYFRFNPSDPAIILPVTVNGKTGRMIVDTGASRTVLTGSFAKSAGIAVNADDGATVTTANGKIWQMSGRAKNVSLGDAQATDVPVFVQSDDQPGFGDDIDGLLGLSFLGNFRFTLNKGVLELSPVS